MSACGCDLFSDDRDGAACRGSSRPSVVTRPKYRRSSRVAPSGKPSVREAPVRKPSVRAVEKKAPVRKPSARAVQKKASVRKPSARAAPVRKSVASAKKPTRKRGSRSKKPTLRTIEGVTTTETETEHTGTPSGDSTTDPTNKEQAELTDKEWAIAQYREKLKQVWGKDTERTAMYY